MIEHGSTFANWIQMEHQKNKCTIWHIWIILPPLGLF
jgi:hypothetical protein